MLWCRICRRSGAATTSSPAARSGRLRALWLNSLMSPASPVYQQKGQSGKSKCSLLSLVQEAGAKQNAKQQRGAQLLGPAWPCAEEKWRWMTQFVRLGNSRLVCDVCYNRVFNLPFSRRTMAESLRYLLLAVSRNCFMELQEQDVCFLKAFNQ